jgi:hypothetical protein
MMEVMTKRALIVSGIIKCTEFERLLLAICVDIIFKFLPSKVPQI